MATMLVVFAVLAVFFMVGGLLEETVPEKVWDKLFQKLNLD